MGVRLRATCFHFFCSAILIAISAGVVYLIWYPGYLAGVSGVSDVFLLLLLVDVCLGPVVTAIIFSAKKARSELVRDMSVIVLMQLLAFTYGMYSIYSARPVYVVYNASQFDVVFTSELKDYDFSMVSNSRFQKLPIWGPVLVAFKFPTEADAVKRFLFNHLERGMDAQYQPEFYVSYDSELSNVKNNIRPLASLPESVINHLHLSSLGHDQNVIGYLPLFANGHKLYALLNTHTAEIVGVSPLR